MTPATPSTPSTPGLDETLLELVRCPRCHGRLHLDAAAREGDEGLGVRPPRVPSVGDHRHIHAHDAYVFI